MRRRRSGPPTWKPPTSSSVSSSVVKSMTPTNSRPAASSSIAGPPTPFGMEDHRLEAMPRERVADRHHALGGVAEHRDRDAALAVVGAQPVPVLQHAGHRRRDVVEDRRADRIEAEDVDDRVHDHHVARADERPEPRCPDAIGVTMILGMPIGSMQRIALAPSTAPSAPPSVRRRRGAALLEEIERQPLQAEQHAVHRFAAAARLAQRLDGRATEARHLGARDVGHDVERPGEDARVGDEVADAERLQAITDIGDLRALGVEVPMRRTVFMELALGDGGA